jgi:uncharacterized protein
LLEPKPFAVGFRIEHPQPFIDRCQYHLASGQERPRLLPAARYRLATKIRGRGVHSFCMCPGGWIVPAATENDEVVVNGMSLSRRDSPFANSGMVATVEPEDLLPWTKSMACSPASCFKRKSNAPPNRRAAAARWRRASGWPISSRPDFPRPAGNQLLPRRPAAPLHELLPRWITSRMREGLDLFDRQIRGYASPTALLLGFETRTSSPVRIPRRETRLQHPEIAGLFIPAARARATPAASSAPPSTACAWR